MKKLGEVKKNNPEHAALSASVIFTYHLKLSRGDWKKKNTVQHAFDALHHSW